ncbi:hypothetical protein L873DRAFT_1062125 [Choiromyces venosus 120613-1]|uniref:Uncharacterized protein n=1 Tax=Choiromyces venosus 120613-1 TaxID=1336337 RepID=A0A3N4IW65_9PEZI|nr:hypothetical protein L873DRAFT_1062125 [Choiromyces venosus 120613-1]
MIKGTTFTIKSMTIPRHITVTGMTPARYYQLKLHIKSILIPGTPALNNNRFADNDNIEAHRQWLSNALEVIGPRFFPTGGSGYCWPEDRNGIYKAVHLVVRELSLKIRSRHQETTASAGAILQEAKDGAGPAGEIDVQDTITLGGEVMQRQGQDGDHGIVMHEQDGRTMGEEMDAAVLGPEDLYVLTMDEVPAGTLDQACGDDIDWDELLDFNPEEPIPGLTFY